MILWKEVCQFNLTEALKCRESKIGVHSKIYEDTSVIVASGWKFTLVVQPHSLRRICC